MVLMGICIVTLYYQRNLFLEETVELEGTIVEVHKSWLLIEVDKTENEFSETYLESTEELLVVDILNVKSTISFKEGDYIKVKYDGSIQESFPGRIQAIMVTKI